MNWKFHIGRLAQNIEQKLLRSGSRFVRANFPYGRDWMFDVKRLIDNPSAIIDAGANIGSVSLDLSYWFPGTDIYAFEPVKSTYDMLVANTSGKKYIHPLCNGLGVTDEKVNILISTENTINSLKISNVSESVVGSEEIHIIRLDEFAAKTNIKDIAILKIDVEGFEFEVLNGCGTLLNSGIQCIYLEVGYERVPTKVHFSDVEAYLEKYNFELCGIYETRRNMFNKQRIWYSNNLYIKKDLLKI